MAKIRDIDERVTVTVICCEHCHGEPGDCRARGIIPQAEEETGEALRLLERAYEAVGDASQWGLRIDIREFLRRSGSGVA